MKNRPCGIMHAVWFNFPIRNSNFGASMVFRTNVLFSSLDQLLAISFGRKILNNRVSIFQPKTIFTSSKVPSPFNWTLRLVWHSFSTLYLARNSLIFLFSTYVIDILRQTKSICTTSKYVLQLFAPEKSIQKSLLSTHKLNTVSN